MLVIVTVDAAASISGDSAVCVNVELFFVSVASALGPGIGDTICAGIMIDIGGDHHCRNRMIASMTTVICKKRSQLG